MTAAEVIVTSSSLGVADGFSLGSADAEDWLVIGGEISFTGGAVPGAVA
jgi:hypothetical protein